jgi:protein-S-isoprenylcysteine O-methyltransferase Ste14
MNETSETDEFTSSERYYRRDVIRYVVRALFGVGFWGLLLFLPAGTMVWPTAWVYLAVFLLVSLASALVADPQLLLEERGPGKRGRKRWDFILVSVYGVFTAVASPIVAGFDRRHGWSPQLPLWLQLTTLAIYLLGWALHLWAMASNRFFSTVTRIQSERGHSVETGGPYRYVRHPGYVGGILFNLGAPIILGSLWTMIPSGLGALLLVLRTALEDRTLQQELEGYQEYTQHVRHKLIPGVW